jgi:type II secretory pathway pseudopilin PulG
MSKLADSKGFTLVEVLLSIVLIIVITTSVTVPLSRLSNSGSGLSVAGSTFANKTRLAQSHARMSYQDDAWGVKIEQGTITTFKGTDFASRDQSFDIKSPISNNLESNGLNEVVFSKISGLPNNTGTLTLSNDNQSLNIELNEQGVVEY